ncbi:MAG: hypothetical protein ACKOD9_19840, partial [Rubrivivax sp.]
LLPWADPAQRLPIMGALALGFLGAAAAAAWSWRSLVRMRRPVMASAVADLQRAAQAAAGTEQARSVRPGPPAPWSP